MKITEDELAHRKDRIIHVAFQLFCRDGIDRVSVKDVARLADVAEKSIYRYFNTKAELIIATLALLWRELISELIASLDPDYQEKSGLEQVGCLLGCFRFLAERNGPYIMFSYEARLFLARHDTHMTEEFYADELSTIQSLYLEALEKGRRDGSIQAKEDAKDLYYALWGLMRGYVVKIVIYDRMYEGENMWRGRFDTACSLLLGALAHGLVPVQS